MEPRVALITGAGSGIGRQMALTLAQDGMAIAAVDLRPEGLATLEEDLKRHNRRMGWEVADVTDPQALQVKVDHLEKRLGPVDLLIACAGIGVETSALNLQVDEVAALVQVNLLGVVNTIAAVLPGMLERRSGHIVGISSLASFRGVPRMLGYSASKAGLNAFLEGLRVELRPFNITVTIICPGWIRTPMTAKISGPRIGMMEVDEAVRRMVRAIRRRKAFYAFPPSLAWQLRILGWLPAAVSDWVIAKTLRRLKKKP